MSKPLQHVYRQLDRRIIPCLWMLYFLGSATRSTVGLALTMNRQQGHSLQQSINNSAGGLNAHQISLGMALFYVGYVVFEVPSNLFMTRCSPHGWIARMIVTIGIVETCHAALNSVWSFYLLRTLLGVVEAGLWPSMTYYLTLFYPPERLAKRIGWYFTAAQVSAAVVGLVSAGLQKLDGVGGLLGWQWMFLLFGIVCIVDGVATFWWLPDRPFADAGSSVKSKWAKLFRLEVSQRPALDREKSILLREDLIRHGVSLESQSWSFRDLARVCVDIRLWLIVIMYFGVIGIGVGIQNYGSLIISAINPDYDSITLSLLFVPIWIADLIGILIMTPLSDALHRRRGLFFLVPCTIIVVGLLTSVLAQSGRVRYAGLVIVGFGLGPTVPICMAWSADLFRGRDVDVAAAAAAISGLGNIGSIITTYALFAGWPSDKASGYKKSNLVALGMVGLSMASSLALSAILRRRQV